MTDDKLKPPFSSVMITETDPNPRRFHKVNFLLKQDLASSADAEGPAIFYFLMVSFQEKWRHLSVT